MSNENSKGGDKTGESEGAKLRDASSSATATDAVISGPDAQKNQDNFYAQKNFQNHDSPSEQAIKAISPSDASLAQKIQQNKFEITGLDNSAGHANDAAKPTKKFELGVEAEKVMWKQWQERLNAAIGEKLDLKMLGSNIPVGAHVTLKYQVRDDGAFSFGYESNNNQYAKNVVEAFNETLKYHPELKKFPQGTKDHLVERQATFDVKPGKSNHETGDVKEEIRKK